MSWPLRLLLANQFGVNLGFYLLVPYLAGHLSGLGLAAGTVGLVLGARTLSQQGLFLIGGSAADRLGCRGVIIAGCALRTVGFGLFAIVDGTAGLLLAAILTGLSGALFNPAVRAYVAVEAGDRRAEAFAKFNVYANAGALTGPLLGAGLLATGLGFGVVAGVAAAVFALLTLAQCAALPARPTPPQEASVWRDWRAVFTNRRFVQFTAATAAMFALYAQLYLAVPLAAQQVTGTPVAVGGVFALATIAGLAGQVRITAWCRDRWPAQRSIAVGLAVMGLAFLLPLAMTTARGPWPMVTVAVCVLLLSLGYQIAHPFVMELVPGFAHRDLPGTYYGAFYLASGVAAALGSAATGWLWEASGGHGWLLWLPLAAAGLLSAAALTRIERTTVTA